MQKTVSSTTIKEESLKDVLHKYTRYWYLFVLGLFFTMVLAFIFIRYADRTYQTKTTIIIKDDKKGGGAELLAFSDLSFFSNAFSDKIESELVILSSNNLLYKTIQKLSLNIDYFSQGAIKTTELYSFRPFKVNFLDTYGEGIEAPPKLIITALSATSFTIEDEQGFFKVEHNFGDNLSLPFGNIVVVPFIEDPNDFNRFLNKPVLVVYNSIENIVARYQGNLELIHDGKNGEVVQLQVKSPTPEKAEDFLNELVYQYNQDAINDRSQVAQKTSRFIDSRLQIITRELDSVEDNKEQFKSANRLTDIEAEATLILENASEFSKKQVDISTQLELVNSMVDYINQSSDTDLLPANIGINNSEVASAVASYNVLVLEKDRLLKSSTAKNPVVLNLDSEIKGIRYSILESLKNQELSYQIAIKDLKGQENRSNSRLSQVPNKEKLFRGIVRQQNIKEQLYLFLLQQREEASISLAVTSSKAKTVDRAFSSKTPIFPKKRIIYLIAIIAGLLIPFLLLYLYYLLNTKVTNKHDVERVHHSTPIIGEIPKLGRGENELIQHNDRSILAESFRILRTNLQYLLVNKNINKETAKNIFVTSTIKGEGKTFVAFNLALSLAQTGRKVVLVGADIRNPQLQRYLHKDYKYKNGLTEYIMDDAIAATELPIQSEQSKNLSLVMSGVIPPNPAEMLMQPRTSLFFEEIRNHFDYVIVDTAPTMLVTDTLLISKLSDVTLYVIRANYTDKKLLEFPLDAMNDGRLTDVALILNNVKLNNFGYGNKYGYTYTSEKKSFLKRIFNN